MLIPSRRSEDLYAGWWQLIAELGGVPKTLVWDGEGAVGRWRSGRPELTRVICKLRGVLGTKVIVLKMASSSTRASWSAPMTTWRGLFCRDVSC